MNITKTLAGKEIKAVWGSSKVLIKYEVETSDFGTKDNTYEITCEIRGLANGSPELEVVKVVALTNNEDTLVAEAIADHCGWEIGSFVETEFSEAA